MQDRPGVAHDAHSKGKNAHYRNTRTSEQQSSDR